MRINWLGVKGEKDPQLSAANISLKFWWVCVYKAWTSGMRSVF